MTRPLICVDLDDTLWDIRGVIEAAEAEVRAWLIETAPDVAARFDAVAFQQVRRDIVAAEPALAHRISRLREAVLTRAFELCGYSASEAARLGHTGFHVFFAARHRVRMFPGVIDALRWLYDRCTLVALSNGNADIARLGLDATMHAWYSAEMVGKPKPDRALFDLALAFGAVTDPAASVHVGDNPEHDILGARRVGMQALWINPLGAPFPLAEVRPTAELKRFVELPDWLVAAGLVS